MAVDRGIPKSLTATINPVIRSDGLVIDIQIMKWFLLPVLATLLAVQAQENDNDLHGDFVYDKSCTYAVCPTGWPGKPAILNLKNYGQQISAVDCKKTDSRCQATALVRVGGHTLNLQVQYWYRVEAPGEHKQFNTRHAYCHSFAVATGRWFWGRKMQPCKGGGAAEINPYRNTYTTGGGGGGGGGGWAHDDVDPGGGPGGGGGNKGLPGGGPTVPGHGP